ncbi:unnamed protein product [Prunus armeniaca]|nr:unnamed protein product [Prunus armeniaca]CAB4322119.1 unnamed protein product [Prunus armeniaca]
MEFGDHTEMGEHGINLSGGQKQRIQLARAVYQNCDIYLLDDVFSAVDAHTGSEIFKECVRGVLKNKTVLVVTHQVDFLHNVDLILVMRDGMIVQAGKSNDLLNSGLDFKQLVAAHETSMELVEMSTTIPRKSSPSPQISPQLSSNHWEANGGNNSLDQPKSDNRTSKLIKEEEKETGKASTDQTNINQFLPFILAMTIAMYITVLAIFIVGYYLASSRELTRLDSITKAPVIHHFSGSISGVMTIHSCRMQNMFSKENVKRVNANSPMDFHNNGSNEWFGFRMEMLGSLVFCISTVFMFLLPSSIIKPENVGLTLSYGLALNGVLFWAIYMSCFVENKMESVERIKQFTNISSEAALEIKDRVPPSNWPSRGNVELKDLQSLEHCQLKDVVAAKPDKLNSLVADDGDNWSVGKRQLLCLGRVMLKHSRLLFMDEATASVESQTDAHCSQNTYSDGLQQSFSMQDWLKNLTNCPACLRDNHCLGHWFRSMPTVHQDYKQPSLVSLIVASGDSFCAYKSSKNHLPAFVPRIIKIRRGPSQLCVGIIKTIMQVQVKPPLDLWQEVANLLQLPPTFLHSV